MHKSDPEVYIKRLRKEKETGENRKFPCARHGVQFQTYMHPRNAY